MADVQVRFQATPNPNAGKFTANRRIVEGKSSRSFHSPEQAAADPVAAALFEIDGVASVFMVDDFVTVTRQPAADWGALIPRVIDTMERTLA
ncbi:MAG: NifU N-terminal domain-containing protein [Gemmatimonadota bacterium]